MEEREDRTRAALQFQHLRKKLDDAQLRPKHVTSVLQLFLELSKRQQEEIEDAEQEEEANELDEAYEEEEDDGLPLRASSPRAAGSDLGEDVGLDDAVERAGADPEDLVFDLKRERCDAPRGERRAEPARPSAQRRDDQRARSREAALIRDVAGERQLIWPV